MDDNNLNTLVILHRVYGGLSAVGSCCLLGYVSLFAGIFGAAAVDSKQPEPAVFAGIFGVVWLFILAIVVGHAVLNFLAANWIRDRRSWTGVFVVSIINCLNVPLGLALGVFTLIMVNRPWIKSTFTS